MKILAFDIETASVDELHSYVPHDDQGYIRLCGWVDALDPEAEVTISTDPRELLDALKAADIITGHNVMTFDLMALARHTEDCYEQLAAKAFDTMVVERHLVPVAAQGKQPTGFYGLDATAHRYGVPGKMTFGDLIDFTRRRKGEARLTIKRKGVAEERFRPGDETKKQNSILNQLAAMYCGYDRIPLDDPDYVAYLIRDVRASAGLYRAQREVFVIEPETSRNYVRDEHRTTGHMARVTIEGCRVDVSLNTTRLAAGQSRLEAAKTMLHDRYGMPVEGKYPHRSNPGKAAFRAALLGTGIPEDLLDSEWPVGADGSLLTGKEVLNTFVPLLRDAGNTAAVEICTTILAMNGERSVFQTIDTHLTADGKVHPYIGPDQASGRWSMKNPGLTVFGKRGGKATERAVILADTDDEVLVAIDADQVDARVVAAECQDPEYMKLFAPGMDLHSEVAWRVWPSPSQHGPDCHKEARPGCCDTATKCHCDKRDKAKVSGHGFSYGLGANGMAKQQGIPIEDCQRFILGFTEAFPRLAEWKEEKRREAGALPFGETAPSHDSYRVLHTWAGRPVRVERDRAYTQATAMIGQGGTRDVMAKAIRDLPPHIRRKVRAVIHDEIVLSLPKDGAQEAAQAIADGMAFDLKGIRITFGCSRVSRSWAGCYGEQYENLAA